MTGGGAAHPARNTMERRKAAFFIDFMGTAARDPQWEEDFKPAPVLAESISRRLPPSSPSSAGRNQRACGAGKTRTTPLSLDPAGLLSREMKPLPNFEVVTPAPLVLRLTEP